MDRWTDRLEEEGFRRHALARNGVGHLQISGEIASQPLDILVDTGAASTVVDLAWCRARNLPLAETGRTGGGAGGVTLPVYSLRGVEVSVDGNPLRSNGVFAVDLSHVNDGLAQRGARRVDAVLGADVLRHHSAVIDYASPSLFLKPVA